MRYLQHRGGQKLHLVFEIDGKLTHPICGRKFDNYRAGVEVDGTLIFFKEEKDEERVKRIIWNGLSKQLIEVHGKAGTEEYWQPELDKLYKIEGEIEIREEPIKEKIEGLGGNGLATTIKQFAFIKNDVFDTGARLPEQKEEDQREKELIGIIQKAKYSWLNNDSSTLSESEWLARKIIEQWKS